MKRRVVIALSVLVLGAACASRPCHYSDDHCQFIANNKAAWGAW